MLICPYVYRPTRKVLHARWMVSPGWLSPDRATAVPTITAASQDFGRQRDWTPDSTFAGHVVLIRVAYKRRDELEYMYIACTQKFGTNGHMVVVILGTTNPSRPRVVKPVF